MDILAFAQPIRGGIYISALVVCVLFVTLIARSKLPNKQYLMMFLGVKVCVIFCEWVLVHVSAPSQYFWLSLMMLLFFGPAPLLLRFAQGVTSKREEPIIFVVKRWEWGIVVAGLVLLLPLFFASQVLLSVDVSPTLGRFIHLTMSACILLFVLQVLFYWCKARDIYTLELQNLKQHFSTLKQHSLKILLVLLLLVLSNLLFSSIRTLNVWFWNSQAEIAIAANLLEYGVMLWCMFILFHGALPIYAYDKGELTSQLPVELALKTQEHSGQKPPKYAKNQLDNSFRKSIMAKLCNTSMTTQLAQDNAISLTKFAKAIGEKPHYISQVLNQDLQTNFYEFITEHRIQQVIQDLSKPSDQTIYDIALAAGFNSKSTFNTAFKKRTGVTPSKYRMNKLACISPDLN